MNAFDFDNLKQKKEGIAILEEGLQLFEHIWGYKSRSFIAPCYTWHKDTERVLIENGVKYIQGVNVQQQPLNKVGSIYKKIYHYTGQRNSKGQYYLVRNAFFEPTNRPNIDWVEDCFNRVNIAFRCKRPAIISSHRLNYIGFINPINRKNNLTKLRKLLKQIVSTWPDVEFMASDQLGDLIAEKV